MKKIVKFIKVAKDIFIILGIPVLFYYAYQIHNEQINSKNIQIELLHTKIGMLEENQINNVWDKYKSLKEYNEELQADLEKVSHLKDSLQDFIENSKNKGLFLNREQVTNIYKGLKSSEYYKKRCLALEAQIREKLIKHQKLQEEFLKMK
ncbi:hypothetical protein SAMN05444143_1282 [Flavobacterium succinicans]|uniref:Uncharacterized protein n=1 Tax=Flavobacterium succinicans TaxID=29536 RepID=A0A1I5A6W6_9FLAO|nr:hypothetical protein [Flavobacterium succinicans]SFN58222.1 hypothetical protein SAMN05444143_1282 [Flavobacterium succinicans]